MKIYLDNCSLQRPLDDKTQLRITVESEAILGLIGLCETGELELVGSETLLYEAYRNPNALRRLFAFRVMSKATEFVEVNDRVETRALNLVDSGIKPLDALHLACAEEAGAKYLCTFDDGFLKRANGLGNLHLQVVSPTELVSEIEK